MFGKLQGRNGEESSKLIKCVNVPRQKNKDPTMSCKSVDLMNSQKELPKLMSSMKCAMHLKTNGWPLILKPANEVMGVLLLNFDLANL